MGKSQKTMSVTEALTVPRGDVDLTSYDTRATPGFDGDKAEGKAALVEMADVLSDLQERLFAEGRTGGERSILLVLQGMDTSGKGGVTRHAVGLFDPQGVHIKAFKAPTDEELRHEFLWRVQREVPHAGTIGIFDRSHYEDVLIGRVRKLASEAEIAKRYDAINTFEQKLVDAGVTVVKCMLHISPTSRRSGCSRGSTIPPSTGSSTPATSTSALCGPTTSRPTRSRSGGATRKRPHG